MTRFDYILPLASIVIGLALTDLLASLHRLLRARRRVRWHWLPLAWAVVTLLLTLRYWWAFYYLGRVEALAEFFPFVVHLLTSLLPLYLLTAAVLPDEVPPEGVDLLAAHLEQRRYFFGTLTVYFACIVVDSLVRNPLSGGLLVALGLTALAGVMALAMAVSADRRVHTALTLASVALTAVFLTLFSIQIGES